MYQITITKVVETTATTTREAYTNKGVAIAAFSLMRKYESKATPLSFVTISLYEDGELIRHFDNRVGIVIDMEGN